MSGVLEVDVYDSLRFGGLDWVQDTDLYRLQKCVGDPVGFRGRVLVQV